MGEFEMGTTGRTARCGSVVGEVLMKPWVIWSLVVMLSFCAATSHSAARETIDRIVAYVNDDIIVLSELNEEIAPYVERIRQMGYSQEKHAEMLFKLRQDMLDRLIEQQLTDQEIKKAGISINEEEIDQSIERLKQANRMTAEMLTEALEKQGMTLDEYRDRTKEQILRSRLVTREVNSKIVVTDEDIKNYYDTHPEEFKGESSVHLRHLTFSLDPAMSQGQKDAARWEMAGIVKSLAAGTPFPEVEKKFNDQGAGRRGGDLGVFRMNSLSPMLQKAISTTPVGGVTELLETDQGLQIFFLQDMTSPEDKKLSDVSSAISEKVYKQRVDEKFTRWLEDLKKTSQIKIVL
ncbi:MAG: SurA N-terminal domain-containing protein [Pseudomonadota bacterium]